MIREYELFLFDLNNLLTYFCLSFFVFYDTDHREHANRIIHEKLTGNHLAQSPVFDLKQKQ